MTTLYISTDKSDEENAQEAMKAFNFLNDTSAMNLVLWLNERPSMAGMIDLAELETLQGVVWQ